VPENGKKKNQSKKRSKDWKLLCI